MSRDPYADLPQVPSFQVSSDDIKDGEELQPAQRSGILGVEGGQDRSPHLSWSGAPEGTQSFVVTCYDPDAPTASGFWHWAVVDLAATVTTLPAGAGEESGDDIPGQAFQLRNDGGVARFIGAAPPSGHGRHSYHFVVHALDCASLGISKDSSPALLGFNLFTHTLGRGRIVSWFERS